MRSSQYYQRQSASRCCHLWESSSESHSVSHRPANSHSFTVSLMISVQVSRSHDCTSQSHGYSLLCRVSIYKCHSEATAGKYPILIHHLHRLPDSSTSQNTMHLSVSTSAVSTVIETFGKHSRNLAVSLYKQLHFAVFLQMYF